MNMHVHINKYIVQHAYTTAPSHLEKNCLVFLFAELQYCKYMDIRGAEN